MRRIFSIFTGDQQGVHNAALLLAVMAVSNAFIALLRDRFLAGAFGASRELDIYYAAFRIPDILFTLGTMMVASTAFIPALFAAERNNHARAVDLVRSVTTAFVVVMTISILVAELLLPWLTPFIVPGFNAGIQADVTALTRILLLSPLLLGMSALVSSMLQTMKRFGAYTLAPICYNIGIIFGILVLAPRFGIAGVASGVLIGAVLHLGVQIPALWGSPHVPRFGLIGLKDVWRIVAHAFPRTIALAFHQLTFLGITAIASFLSVGAIAVFQLSYNLQSLPLVVVGFSYGIAAFPTLSELAIAGERERFYRTLGSVARLVLFWTIPATVLFIVLRAFVVRAVLGTGAFDWADTSLTAASLALFSLGIVAQSLNQLFMRACYALGRTGAPVFYGAIGFLVTIGGSWVMIEAFHSFPNFTLFFASLLRVHPSFDVGLLALPFAYAIGASVTAVLLAWDLWKREEGIASEGFRQTIREVGASSVVGGAAAFFMLRPLALLFSTDTFIGVVLTGGVAGGVGLIVTIALLFVFGNREARDVTQAVQARFWTASPPAPEVEHL